MAVAWVRPQLLCKLRKLPSQIYKFGRARIDTISLFIFFNGLTRLPISLFTLLLLSCAISQVFGNFYPFIRILMRYWPLDFVGKQPARWRFLIGKMSISVGPPGSFSRENTSGIVVYLSPQEGERNHLVASFINPLHSFLPLSNLDRIVYWSYDFCNGDCRFDGIREEGRAGGCPGGRSRSASQLGAPRIAALPPAAAAGLPPCREITDQTVVRFEQVISVLNRNGHARFRRVPLPALAPAA